jgi:transcriptional regulator with XRE-family HTH domain
VSDTGVFFSHNVNIKSRRFVKCMAEAWRDNPNMHYPAEPHSLPAVGRRLRACREAVDLDQPDFAQWGIERTRLSQWENGRRAPNAFSLIPFCERFGISLDYIFRGDPRALPHGLYGKIMEKLEFDQRPRRGRPVKEGSAV